jgi:hypothetical protein
MRTPFWRPSTALLVVLFIFVGAFFGLRLSGSLDSKAVLLMLASLTSVAGLLLISVTANAQLPKWVLWINPYFRSLEERKGRLVAGVILLLISIFMATLVLSGAMK